MELIKSKMKTMSHSDHLAHWGCVIDKIGMPIRYAVWHQDGKREIFNSAAEARRRCKEIELHCPKCASKRDESRTGALKEKQIKSRKDLD